MKKAKVDEDLYKAIVAMLVGEKLFLPKNISEWSIALL